MIRVGLLGHGVVGSGVAEILRKNGDVLWARTGQRLELASICDLRDSSHLEYASLFTKDALALARDKSIDVFVECMGGVEPARSFVLEAVRQGKHVVTSNKALVVAAGEEIAALAQEKGVRFLYEASVGGGIPVVTPIRQCLAANRLDRIAGILNGTTNYILTRMKDGGVSFDAALQEAQRLGYAESDPSADVQGDDARRKICILAHIAFGSPLDDGHIFTEGISALTREDMLYARELGRSVKLLAVAELVSGGWRALVAPAMLPQGHPLGGVDDVFNAVLVHGDMVDDVLFYGRGAGALPTASAMVGDVLDIALHPGDAPLCPPRGELAVLPSLGGQTRLFTRVLRAPAETADRALAQIPGSRLVRLDGPAFQGEFGLITEEGEEAALRKAIDELGLPHGAVLRYMSV